MALWQAVLVLALIVGTVGVTYGVFRYRYPPRPAPGRPPAGVGTATPPPDPAAPGGQPPRASRDDEGGPWDGGAPGRW